jgi:hypothetical protein
MAAVGIRDGNGERPENRRHRFKDGDGELPAPP